MEDQVYTVQEIIDYFEGKSGESYNADIEGFASGNAESATVFRNLMRERRVTHSASSRTDGIAQPVDNYPEMMEKRKSNELVSADHMYSADVDGAHITDVTGGEDSMDEEVLRKQATGVSSDTVIDSSDVGVEKNSGVTGGDVDNSTVVGVVKGGMRNKQTVIDSDICITGNRGHPDGVDTDADHKQKEVTGVADGVVKDSTIVGEVHGGMENEQTIDNSKIYSDGGFGGNLHFLDLNIRQREDAVEQQDGAVQIIKDCIIDLRKPDDPTDKDNKSDDADCDKDKAGSATGTSAEEPDEETEKQEMQKKIQEVKEQSEREEETRKLMLEKQAAMEEQLQREQRERERMQYEVQRISNEQRQTAAYRGHPNPVVFNPHMAAGGLVVAPATTRLVYVNPTPKPAKTGTGLMENINQFINGLKKQK